MSTPPCCPCNFFSTGAGHLNFFTALFCFFWNSYVRSRIWISRHKQHIAIITLHNCGYVSMLQLSWLHALQFWCFSLQNSVGQSLLLEWLVPHAENFLCNKVPWTHGREKIDKINVMPETSVIVAHVEGNLFTQQTFPIFFLLLPEIDFTIQKMPTLTVHSIPWLYPPFGWFPGHILFQGKSSLETNLGFIYSKTAPKFIINFKFFSPRGVLVSLYTRSHSSCLLAQVWLPRHLGGSTVRFSEIFRVSLPA